MEGRASEEKGHGGGTRHVAELHGNRRPSPAPQLTAVAASCIDYARWPLSRQASWARAEAYWIIDVLTLASQSRGQSSKESAREQTLETEANCHTSSASCGRSRKVSKEMAQSDGKMHVCVGYTAPNAHSLHSRSSRQTPSGPVECQHLTITPKSG